MYEWSDTVTRCPGCFKHVHGTVLGLHLNVTPKDWDNAMSRARAAHLAREGVCPWCGRRTTTPARTLLARFEKTLMSFERAGLFV